MTKTYRRRIE